MTVLVTRPDIKGSQLTEMLNDVGIVAIHLPLFSITAGRELDNLPLRLNELDSGDYVFSVSQYAVSYADITLKNTGFSWRIDLEYFAVGKRTAEYFSSHIQKSVLYPITEESSEGLLGTKKMQNIQGKNILILRGNKGREFFAEKAVLRGAKIQYIECYQRLPIQYDSEKIKLYQRAGVDTIVVTSLESLHYLIDFVSKQENLWLKSCQLVTVSERIANVAQYNGWNKVVVSTGSDNQALLHTLQLLY